MNMLFATLIRMVDDHELEQLQLLADANTLHTRGPKVNLPYWALGEIGLITHPTEAIPRVVCFNGVHLNRPLREIPLAEELQTEFGKEIINLKDRLFNLRAHMDTPEGAEMLRDVGKRLNNFIAAMLAVMGNQHRSLVAALESRNDV